MSSLVSLEMMYSFVGQMFFLLKVSAYGKYLNGLVSFLQLGSIPVVDNFMM